MISADFRLLVVTDRRAPPATGVALQRSSGDATANLFANPSKLGFVDRGKIAREDAVGDLGLPFPRDDEDGNRCSDELGAEGVLTATSSSEFEDLLDDETNRCAKPPAAARGAGAPSGEATGLNSAAAASAGVAA